MNTSILLGATHNRTSDMLERLQHYGRRGTRVSALVELRIPADDEFWRRMVVAASRTISSRATVTRPSNLLPEPWEHMLSLQRDPMNKALRTMSSNSFAVQMAQADAVPTSESPDAARSEFVQQVRQLSRLIPSFGRKIQSLHEKEPLEETGTSGVPWALLSARCVALDATMDDFRTLIEAAGPAVRAVHPNRILRLPPLQDNPPSDEHRSRYRASTWGVEQSGALAAWGAFDVDGSGVRVGVLDTGVDPGHPDLAGRVAGFASFDQHGGIRNVRPQDADRHGTHVCGTIAGGRSSGRWIGVAPGADLVVGQVLDEHGGTDRQILAGFDWIVQQEIHVLNLSLGALTFESDVDTHYQGAILDALRRGIPVVAAIGNNHGCAPRGWRHRIACSGDRRHPRPRPLSACHDPPGARARHCG